MPYKKGTHRIEIGLDEKEYRKAKELVKVYRLRSIAELCKMKIKTDLWFEHGGKEC